MCLKLIKWGVIGAAGLAVAGGLVFGTDAVSYLTSSAKSVRTAVKDNVPIEFELRRAHDLLGDIIPEMQANIRLIAQEEVEVVALKTDIEHGHLAMDEERHRADEEEEAQEGDGVFHRKADSPHPSDCDKNRRGEDSSTIEAESGARAAKPGGKQFREVDRVSGVHAHGKESENRQHDPEHR